MTITYHTDFDQGSGEWLAARCGLLTASEIDRIITPTLKIANNDKTRTHLYELLAQRITKHVEPAYIGDDMLRGMEDEIIARDLYSTKYAPVTQCGFVTNDEFGFTLGCSPDGLVADDGMIEIKSRRQKYQIQTIIENVGTDQGETIPADYVIQVQTELLVTRREWCDFISYSGGLPMATIRVFPDAKVQAAIIEAATDFEAKLAEKWAIYNQALASKARLIPTERRVVQEMF